MVTAKRQDYKITRNSSHFKIISEKVPVSENYSKNSDYDKEDEKYQENDRDKYTTFRRSTRTKVSFKKQKKPRLSNL